jgi:uncharacterized protein (TIGR03435 family)
MTPGRLQALCVTPATLIRAAYGVANATGDVIKLDFNTVFGLGNNNAAEVRGGPDWVRSDRYTIEAVGDDAASAQALSGPMLRDLLERRFHLSVHTESEPVSGFALTVAPGGLKMTRVEADGCTMVPPPSGPQPATPYPDAALLDRLRRGEKPTCGLRFVGTASRFAFLGGAVSVTQLVEVLPEILGARVLDRTGLPATARFNLVLEFSLDERTTGPLGGRGRAGAPVPGETRAADLFTALKEQLGLTLDTTQTPREYVVIDRIERPSAN